MIVCSYFLGVNQKNESSLLFVAPSPQTSMSGASKRLRQLFLEQVRSPMHQNLIKFALLDALQEDASRCQSLIQIPIQSLHTKVREMLIRLSRSKV